MTQTTALASEQHEAEAAEEAAEEAEAERQRADVAAAYLAAIVTSAEDAIASKTLDGIVTSWNTSAERMFGYTAEEMIGQPILRLFPPDRLAEEDLILARIRAGERIEHFETVRVTKDCRQLDVSLTISPIRDRVGAIIGASKIVRDLTERKQMEHALRASEARYRATFESAAIGVAVVDLTGRPLEVNAYVSQMVGYTADELRTMALRDFTHPDDVADNETLLGSALTGAIGSYQLEKRYRHKDGHTVWGRVSASLVRDRDGQPAYVVVHLEDVTPRKQLEQEREAARAEAERQAEELDRVFEQSAEGLAVYDATGQLVRTNAALRTLLGLDAAPLHYWQLSLTERARLFQAQSLDGRLLATDEAPVQRALHGAVIAGADALEMALHTEDGREVVLSASAAPLRDRAGRIVGAVGVIRDQTERARLEREREAARAAAEAQAEELDRIFEQMTEALMVYDADGHIVRENAAMRRVRGADVAPPGDGQLPASERLKWYVLRDAAGRPFKIEDTPQLRALRGEELTGERAVDLRMRSLDGRDLELRVSATPLRDAAGRIVGAVSSGVDLTERNRLMREREEALEASETWFHSVSDTAPVFIWTTDTEGLATFVNLPWLHLTGQTLEHELGEGWMEGIHLDDYERCVQTYWTAVENRQPFTMDYRIRCADGEYRWLVTTGVPRVAPDGAFLGYIGSAIDISERRQLEAEREEALVASEAWFRALADTAPVLVWVSGVDGLVTFVNLPWMQFSGRTMEQELGDGWAEGVHPDDYARCLQTYRTAFDARQPFTMEYRLRRADGEYRWLVDTGVPRFGPNRTFLGYIGSAMDITERRQLEAEREEARIQAERRAEELDRVFETMTDGVAVYDQHGQVVRANAALQRLLGLDAAPPSYAERSLLERVALFDPRDEHGQSLAPADLPVPRALAGRATGGAESMVMRMRTLDGREVELLVSAAPLHSPTEELVGAVSVYHDLTERNRLAHEQEEGRARELALREVNQRLDTFVSMAAHDLRRPVAVSRMRIELTQRQVQKAAVNVRSTAEQAQPFIQVAHDLEVARQSLDRLTGFMEQLLDVTRARQDHLALNRQPCDLVALVRACVEEQRLLAPGRRLTLDLPLDQPGARPSATPQEPQEPQEPPAVMVHADAARLGQVVVNYLTNAERYSPADQSIELSLRVIEQAVEQATDVAPVCVARVSVRDHGPGIALDAQHAIWERFQRAHTLREAMGTGGLGLGLYIARMIITLHGGQVGVESTPGEGATFWFTLPLSAAKE